MLTLVNFRSASPSLAGQFSAGVNNLHVYESVSDAKAGIARYIGFYNSHRPHSSLDKSTPDEFYFETLPKQRAAA